MLMGLWGYGPGRGADHYATSETPRTDETPDSRDVSEALGTNSPSGPPGFDVVGIILRCRRTADLSQRELAAVLGVSASTVARWETGERIPNAVTVGKIAELAGYRLGLFDHHDEPVKAAPRETLRDRGGRRIPPHLDVVLHEDTVWRPNALLPGGWECLKHTIHTPRRWWRDVQRDQDARTAAEQASGCVPFHSDRGGSRRRCRDIPTPRDHAHWAAVVREIHQTRQQAMEVTRAHRPKQPEPEPCFCDVDCDERTSCPPDCRCGCEPATSG